MGGGVFSKKHFVYCFDIVVEFLKPSDCLHCEQFVAFGISEKKINFCRFPHIGFFTFSSCSCFLIITFWFSCYVQKNCQKRDRAIALHFFFGVDLFHLSDGFFQFLFLNMKIWTPFSGLIKFVWYCYVIKPF